MSVNWVITLRRRYDDPTSPAHAGRTPAAKLLRWNHSIVPPPRRRIRRTFSSLLRSTGSGGDSPLPTVPDSRHPMAILLYQIKGMTLDEDKNLLQVQAGSEVG